MANVVQPALGILPSCDALKGAISVTRIMRTGALLYLLDSLTTNENQSNFSTLCIFLCLCSLLIEICAFYLSIDRGLSKKLSFVMAKVSFSNLWIVVLTTIRTKLRDSFEYKVMSVIFGACFVLSAMYFANTYVHVFKKRPMSYLERETNSSHNSRKLFGNSVANNEDDKKENIIDPFLINYGQIISIGHAYLILCFLDEKESTFQLLGIFLCLSSAFIEFNEFFAKDRVSSKKFTFAAHIYFLVNVWVAVLILMYIKLPDFFTNVAFRIYAPCFILSAIYFAHMHAFEKEPFPVPHFKSLQNDDIHEVATKVLTVLTCVHAYYLVCLTGDKASNWRTLAIFLCLTSGFVAFNGLFYSLRRPKPDRVAEKKKKLLFVMQTCYFAHWVIEAMRCVPIVLYSERSRSRTVAQVGILAMVICCMFFKVKKDPYSHFKGLCNITDNSRACLASGISRMESDYKVEE